MAKIKDPNRELAFNLWKDNPDITNREIARRLEVDEKKIATWKLRDKWKERATGISLENNKTISKKKNCSTTKKVDVIQQNKECNTKKENRKKIKEVAKALIEEGYSLKEVSEQTGIPKSTIANWSAKENLQQSQLQYLKQFRGKYQDRIEKNKLLRLETNEEALKAINHEILNWRETGRISKAAMEKLLLNEEAEQLIFGLDRIERLEQLELELKKKELEISKLKESIDNDDNDIKLEVELV